MHFKVGIHFFTILPSTVTISPEKLSWYGEALAFVGIPIFRREVMGGVT